MSAHQRNIAKKKQANDEEQENSSQSLNIINPMNLPQYPTGITLNLMEEVLLCGMKDDEV